MEVVGVGNEPHEGGDVVAGDGGSGGQRSQHLHRLGGQADLLFGFTQGRGQEVGVLRVPDSARKGDLAPVVLHQEGALGEQHLEYLSLHKQGHQHPGGHQVRGRGRPGRLLGQMVLEAGQD